MPPAPPRSTPPAAKRRGRGFFAAAQAARRTQKACLSKRGFTEARIVADWAAVVGPHVAAWSAPLRLDSRRAGDATLYVAIEPSRAAEAQHLASALLGRVNQFYGYAAAQRIVFSQGLGPRRAPPAQPPEPRPLRPSEEAQLRAAVADVDDDRLRDALTRLGRLVAAQSDPPGAASRPSAVSKRGWRAATWPPER